MRRLRLIVLLGAMALSGCPSPVTPPGPPAEVPSSLVLPDPRIDVSEIAGTPSSSVSALVGSGGEFSDEIAIGPDRITNTNDLFGAILEPFRELSIPVSASTTTFTSEVSFPGLSSSQEAKLDFSPFDYDGDGLLEGCSGNTAALPICLRMWVGGEPFMEAVFDEFPTLENPGRGKFKLSVPPVLASGDAGVRFAFVYDHRDPAAKTTDAFFFAPPESFAKTYRRALISETGAEGFSKKSVDFSDRFFFDPSDPDVVQYIGAFRQNPDPNKIFWSGSLDITPRLMSETPSLSNISGVCAQVSSGNGVLSGTCQDLGIDTTGSSFIDFATDADFAFSDFPSAPTF